MCSSDDLLAGHVFTWVHGIWFTQMKYTSTHLCLSCALGCTDFHSQYYFSYYGIRPYIYKWYIYHLYLFKANIAHNISEPKIVSTDAPSRSGCGNFLLLTDPELQTWVFFIYDLAFFLENIFWGHLIHTEICAYKWYLSSNDV